MNTAFASKTPKLSPPLVGGGLNFGETENKELETKKKGLIFYLIKIE